MKAAPASPLPPGWCWTTLGECCLFTQYGTSSKTTSELVGVPVLRMGNISTDGKLDLHALKYLPPEHHEFPELLLEEGDLLFNRTNSAELVGKTVVYKGVPSPCSFASYLIRVRLGTGVLPDLVAAFINGPLGRNWIKTVVSQTVGQANVNGAKLHGFSFPLPPLNEQKRIVETLDELLSDLDAGIEALERAQTKLKHYRAVVLKAAVEGQLTAEWRKQHPDTESASELLERILVERRQRWEEGELGKFSHRQKEPPRDWQARYSEPIGCANSTMPELPVGWTWVTVGQMLRGIEAGKSFDCEPRPAASGEWGVIKVSAMTWGTFDETENKAVPQGQGFDPYNEIRPGDLLLSRSNTAQLVGATVLVGACKTKLLLSDKSMRLLYSPLVNPSWLLYSLSSTLVRDQISRLATGTSDSMRNISQDKLNSVVLPLPPINEQQAVVEAVEEQLSMIDHLEADLKAKLTAAQALWRSILHRAFTGQLVPQDPNDEPASELLKRIAAERAKRSNSKPGRRARTA